MGFSADGKSRAMDQQDAVKLIRRCEIKDKFISSFMGSIEERVDRYLDIDHQWIIGEHHFSKSSSECVDLYRDGYFIAAVMMSHAINEAIIKFAAERNPQVNRQNENGGTKSLEALINELAEKGIVSSSCGEASKKIWDSFRADVHHLLPRVSEIDFANLARENLKRLAIIEKEIFGVGVMADGKIIPHNPQYWDLNKDGRANVFLRLE